MTIDLNKIMLIGRCTSSVEIKFIPTTNVSVVNFTIVTNHRHKNNVWAIVSEPEYHKCTAYWNSADILWKYLIKWKRMYVEGRLKTRKRTDAAWNDRYTTEIIIADFNFLDSKPGSDEHLDQETAWNNVLDEYQPE